MSAEKLYRYEADPANAYEQAGEAVNNPYHEAQFGDADSFAGTMMPDMDDYIHGVSPDKQDMELYLENRPESDLAADKDRAIQEDADRDEDRYENMGMLELARELAQAELREDRTTAGNVSDVLLGKMADHADKMSSKDLKVGEADDALYDRIIGYKDTYKDQLATTAQRDRINPEKAQYMNNLMKDAGISDETIKDAPIEYFYESDDPDFKDPSLHASDEINSKVNYYREHGKSQDEVSELRDRVLPVYAADLAHALKDAGLSDEALSALPKEYFYNSNDPEYRNIFADNPAELSDVLDAVMNASANEKTNETRDRINPAVAESLAQTLKQAGVSDEVLNNLSPEYFYDPSDPEFKNIFTDGPEEVAEAFKSASERAHAARPVPPANGSDDPRPRRTPEHVEDDESLPAEAVKVGWKGRIADWKRRLKQLMNPRSAAYNSGSWKHEDIEKARKDQRRVIIGGAVGAVIMAGTAYAMFKSGNGVDTDVVRTIANVNPIDTLTDTINNTVGNLEGVAEAAPAPSETAEVVEKMTSFDVRPGEGFTQVISHLKEAQGLSPDQLKDVVDQAVDQGLIGKTNTYLMGNGDLGINDASKTVRLNESAIIEMIERAKAK